MNSLLAGEEVQPKGRATDLKSLPTPWSKFVEFIKWYVTCEGWFQVVFHYDFILLSHLRHRNLINLPFFLLQSLHNMANYTKRAKNPSAGVSNHRLIQHLVHRKAPAPDYPRPVHAETTNPKSSARYTTRMRVRPPVHSNFSNPNPSML